MTDSVRLGDMLRNRLRDAGVTLPIIATGGIRTVDDCRGRGLPGRGSAPPGR